MTRLTLLLLTTSFLLLGLRSIGQTTQDTTDYLYKENISKGDIAFAHKNFQIAKYYYQTASQIKPMEKYPRSFSALCDSSGIRHFTPPPKQETTEPDSPFSDILHILLCGW
jgi:hypothetical protein